MNVTMSALYRAIVDRLVLNKNTAQLKSDSTGTLPELITEYISHLRQQRILGLMFFPETKCSRIATEANVVHLLLG